MSATSNIKIYLKSKKIPLYKFLESIGKSNGYLNSTKDFSLDTIKDIIRLYPDLNLDWLITGEGSMLKSGQESGNTITRNFSGDFTGGTFNSQIGGSITSYTSSNANSSKPTKNKTKESDLEKEVIRLNKENRDLSHEISILKTKIEEKDNFIKMLLEKN